MENSEEGGEIENEIGTDSERGRGSGRNHRFEKKAEIVDNGFDFSFDFIVSNIQGVTVTKALQMEADYLRGHEPLFICLSETWLRETSVGGVSFNDYVLGSYYCRSDKIRGGVACYAHTTVKFDILDIGRHCVEMDMEVCGVVWRVSDRLSVCVITCYRSPSASIDIFLARVGDLLDSIYMPTVPIIFTGDINISPEYNPNEYVDLVNLFAAYNMTNRVLEPTRVTSHSSSRVDHVWTNLGDCGGTRVIANPFSDHDTVLFDSGILNSRETVTPKIKKRLYNSGSRQRFLSKLFEERWDDVLLSPDFDDMFNSFYNIFIYHFNENFPVVSVRPREVTRGWVNSEIRESSCRLRDLYMIQREYPAFMGAYRYEKNRHSDLVRTTRRSYYQRLISNNDKHRQGQVMWRVIGELTNKKRNAANIVLKIDDVEVDNPDQISNEFNNYFIQAPLKIISGIKQGGAHQLYEGSLGVGDRVANSMFIERFTEMEIEELIRRRLKPKMSTGPDEIPAKILKEAAFVVLPILTHLVNSSFQSGSFPHRLKVSRVIPVFKKGSRTDMSNYRPVAINSCFSKIFELCMLKRLLCYLDKEKILTNAQHGFRCSRSTMTAFDSFYKRVISLMETGECPAGIFCDLSRAFDCVPHTILLNKLYDYGVRGLVLDWIESYLSSRAQYVDISSNIEGVQAHFRSDSVAVEVGVPQGSVLGPVLFLLYINDLPCHLSAGTVVMFADDTSSVISGGDSGIVEMGSNELLNELSRWFQSNLLYLNASKTSYLRFHNPQNHSSMDLNISIDDHTVDRLAATKFLGLQIDDTLHWKEHCLTLVQKMHSLCYQVRNLRYVLTTCQMRQFYMAQVESRLSYGICYWGCSALMPKIFVAQKKIVRGIFGVGSRHSCRELFARLRILTVYGLYIYNLIIYIYKNKSAFDTNGSTHMYSTRGRDDLVMPPHRLRVSDLSPYIMGPRFFNRLPERLRTCRTCKEFSRHLKHYLIDRCLYEANI